MHRAPITRAAAWGFLIVAALLAGCAATPPVTYYTLTPLPPDNTPLGVPPPDSALSVGVGPVNIPDVLDRPQIVTRPNPNRVEMAEFHRWGGSLKESLPRVLAEDIAAGLGGAGVMLHPWRERDRPAYRVTVDILRLDGRLGGAVDLEAMWKVTSLEKEAVSVVDRSAIRTPVTGDGYEALVAAQSRAVASLAEAISRAIRELAAGASPRGD